MSRSWKKKPYSKDKGIGKDAKRICAHRVRNIPIESEDSDVLIASPSAYKKVNEDTWEIHDYVSHYTKDDAVNHYYTVMNEPEDSPYRERFLKQYPTLEEYLNKVWAKYFKRK